MGEETFLENGLLGFFAFLYLLLGQASGARAVASSLAAPLLREPCTGAGAGRPGLRPCVASLKHAIRWFVGFANVMRSVARQDGRVAQDLAEPHGPAAPGPSRSWAPGPTKAHWAFALGPSPGPTGPLGPWAQSIDATTEQKV